MPNIKKRPTRFAGRPTVDETLCFICQEKTPTHLFTRPATLVERPSEPFKLCEDCLKITLSELASIDRVKKAIYSHDKLRIFEQTLGANLIPSPKPKVEKL